MRISRNYIIGGLFAFALVAGSVAAITGGLSYHAHSVVMNSWNQVHHNIAYNNAHPYSNPISNHDLYSKIGTWTSKGWKLFSASMISTAVALGALGFAGWQFDVKRREEKNEEERKRMVTTTFGDL